MFAWAFSILHKKIRPYLQDYPYFYPIILLFHVKVKLNHNFIFNADHFYSM